MYKWQRIWVIETNSLPRSVDIENLPDSTNQSYKVTCLGFVNDIFGGLVDCKGCYISVIKDPECKFNVLSFKVRWPA